MSVQFNLYWLFENEEKNSIPLEKLYLLSQTCKKTPPPSQPASVTAVKPKNVEKPINIIYLEAHQVPVGHYIMQTSKIFK